MRRFCWACAPGYPMEDDYRAKSEFFDSLVPNKNLLLALAVAGVCLAVASLAIGTFQSGRNPEEQRDPALCL